MGAVRCSWSRAKPGWARPPWCRSGPGAFEDGACVLFGHCEEDLAIPYHCSPRRSVTPSALPPMTRSLQRGVPRLRAPPDWFPPWPADPDLRASKATDADTGRYLLFAAVVGVLPCLGAPARRPRARRPAVGRQGKPALAASPGGGRPGHRVLVLATYRDSEVAAAYALVDPLACASSSRGGVAARAGRPGRQRSGGPRGG